MAKKSLPDPAVIRQLLDYDPGTGKLFWIARPAEMFAPGLHGRQHQANAWNARYAGKEAFTAVTVGGYLIGTIFCVMVKAHRVAWAHYHGSWPSDHIDHINGDPQDNRIKNLRDVPNIENHKNTKKSKNNTSGVNGVHWCSYTGRWRAVAKLDYKMRHIGRYDTIEEAEAARLAANVSLGFSERHGS